MRYPPTPRSVADDLLEAACLAGVNTALFSLMSLATPIAAGGYQPEIASPLLHRAATTSGDRPIHAPRTERP